MQASLRNLPLLTSRPRFTLLAQNRVKLNLDGILRGVTAIALTPIIADSIGKDIAVLGEAGSDDAAADFGVSLEAVFGVLVPEVEGAV